MRELQIMRTIHLSLLASALNLHAASDAWMSIGPTFSGGEIDKQYSHDMAGTTGIYEYGANVSVEKTYLEANLQFEMGWYDRNPAYGLGLDLNGKYGVLQDRLKLYAGFGFAYNGYTYDHWIGHNSMNGQFTHDYSPYLSAKAEVFQRLRIGFEGLFHSGLFWKVRIGLPLFHFH
jgi:hypothetical protein